MLTEKEIILKAKTDISAFDYVYDKYFPKIFSFVMYKVANREIAEEIVSNVFFKAMNKLSMFRWRQIPFSAWLYRIAISETANYFRGVKRRKKIEEDFVIESSIVKDEEKDNDFAFIHEYLQKLNDKDLNLITLRFFEKKSFSEISEILGVKENTLRVKIHRSLKKLEKLIPKEVLKNVFERVS